MDNPLRKCKTLIKNDRWSFAVKGMKCCEAGVSGGTGLCGVEGDNHSSLPHPKKKKPEKQN